MKKKWIFVLVVIIVIVGIAGAAVVYYQKHKSNIEDKPEDTVEKNEEDSDDHEEKVKTIIHFKGTWEKPDEKTDDASGLLYYELPDGKSCSIKCPESFSLSSISDFTVPKKIAGLKVVSLEPGAFANTPFTHIYLPDTVSFIGQEAFSNCQNLVSIDIPKGVDTIRAYTFYNCTSLENITLPDTLLKIEGHAFKSNTKLQNIYIPNKVSEIGEDAFTDCFSLRSIHLPDNLQVISRKLFYNAGQLAEITIPNKVKKIETAAFGESGITTLTIPDSVEMISNFAFLSCNLTEIHLNSQGVFYYDTSLQMSNESPLDFLFRISYVFDDKYLEKHGQSTDRPETNIYVPKGSIMEKAVEALEAYYNEMRDWAEQMELLVDENAQFSDYIKVHYLDNNSHTANNEGELIVLPESIKWTKKNKKDKYDTITDEHFEYWRKDRLRLYGISEYVEYSDGHCEVSVGDWIERTLATSTSGGLSVPKQIGEYTVTVVNFNLDEEFLYYIKKVCFELPDGVVELKVGFLTDAIWTHFEMNLPKSIQYFPKDLFRQGDTLYVYHNSKAEQLLIDYNLSDCIIYLD